MQCPEYCGRIGFLYKSTYDVSKIEIDTVCRDKGWFDYLIISCKIRIKSCRSQIRIVLTIPHKSISL